MASSLTFQITRSTNLRRYADDMLSNALVFVRCDWLPVELSKIATATDSLPCLQIWKCTTDESNRIVHDFFESQHFAAGILPIPGKYNSLVG